MAVQYIITGERRALEASALAPDANEIIENYSALSDDKKVHIRAILKAFAEANVNNK
ncbi:MAG: hypothetical protein OQK82_03730 [Candidatus Pacearchaeota archaeon]|nr:hypothetical protein [Candidatus Pacearchaeota archaeon]